MAVVYDLALGGVGLFILGYGLVAAVAEHRCAGWRWLVALVSLVLGAATVRVLLATFGPGDLIYNISSVFHDDPSYSDRLGGGAVAFYRAFFLVLPRRPESIVYVNIALGALTPLFVFAHLRFLAFRRGVAWASAALLAFMPTLIVYSGNSSRQTLLLASVAVALMAHARFLKERRTRDLVVSVLAASFCAFVRPDGVLVGAFWALQALFLGACTREIRRPQWMAFGAIVGLSLISVVSSGSGGMLVDEWLRADTWIRAWIFLRNAVVLNAEYTPVVVVGLAAIGVGAAFVEPSRRGLVIYAALAIAGVAIAFTPMVTYPRQLTDSRYQVSSYLFLVLLAATGIELLARAASRLRHPKTVLTTVGVLAFFSLGSYFDLFMPHDIDAEFRFLRTHMPELPRNAVIYTAPLGDAGCDSGDGQVLELGLTPPFGLRQALGRKDLTWETWPPRAPYPDRPLLYYAAASCFSMPQQKLSELYPLIMEDLYFPQALREHYDAVRCRCRQALQLVGQRPIAEAHLPARSWSRIRYERSRVPVGFYEVEPSDLARLAARPAAEACPPPACPQKAACDW